MLLKQDLTQEIEQVFHKDYKFDADSTISKIETIKEILYTKLRRDEYIPRLRSKSVVIISGKGGTGRTLPISALGAPGISSARGLTHTFVATPTLPTAIHAIPTPSTRFAPIEGFKEPLKKLLGDIVATEILRQKEILNKSKKFLRGKEGEVAVACGGEIFLGETLGEAVSKAKEKYGDMPFYAGIIRGIVEFPSIYG